MEKEESRFGSRQDVLFRGIEYVCTPVYRIRCVNRGIKQRDYVVTLRKKNRVTTKDRLFALYDFLKETLLPSEVLTLENDSFAISGNTYLMTFSVEWYKNAEEGLSTFEDKIGVKKLHRIGVERSVCCLRRLLSEPSDLYESMQFFDWIERYPNPADRFAAIAISAIRKKH